MVKKTIQEAATPAKKKTTLAAIANSKLGWDKLKVTPNPPRLAFKIGTYIRKTINENVSLIEEQAAAFIKQFNTAAKGETPSVDPKKDRAKYDGFVKAYDEYLSTEIEIPFLQITMEELITELEKIEDAAIDPDMIVALAEFFIEEADGE